MAISTTWDATFQAAPLGNENISNGDNRIVALKDAIQERMAQEHQWDPAGTQANHGLHVTGSALSNVSSGTPTRPNGDAVATSADNGRMWFDSDDDSLRFWTGSSWTRLSGFANILATGTLGVSGTATMATVNASGSVNVTGDVSCDDIVITDEATFKRRRVSSDSYYHASGALGLIYDKLSSVIPNTNDYIVLNGGIGNITTGTAFRFNGSTIKINGVESGAATILTITTATSTNTSWSLGW